ncbi:hypothetical protein FisN_22Lh132 [Fistulifera solaris]|uniref:Uncharacterized protein n=1 Tax=Fistulifera solaris TaxID=1519565 RepID=A0A1Z5JCE2_FISSO|nr:hypothetical protein FisN_22Lh132 [Fistulifera solaris]|eukprot:GAX11448.1 hypothetical protein FisN_22Lh132 [Fistulifera solaris]
MMKLCNLLPFLFLPTVLSQCPDGWETGLSEWTTNNNKFTPPPCYQFTLTTNRISTAPSVRSIRVKNGVAQGGEMSLSDYMTEISSLCYMRCPVEGAACRIAYYAAGYPYQILIDQDNSVVGEERNVEISGYAPLACEDIVDVPVPVPAPVPEPLPAPLPAPVVVVEPILSDAPSDAPSDFLSDAPSDVPSGGPVMIVLPTPIVTPVAAPLVTPVAAPVLAPVGEDPTAGGVSDLNTDTVGLESSAPGLTILLMIVGMVVLQVFA